MEDHDVHPSKRAKNARERNPFIDDEVVVNYDVLEAEDGQEDNFIQLQTADDDDDDDIELGLHAQVNAAMRTEDQETGENDDNDTEESNSEDEDRIIELSLTNGVWEIRCKMGREWEAIATLLEAGIEDRLPIVKSATFRDDHPGRIYVELSPGPTFQAEKQEARQIATRASLSMLTPTSMRFIPCPDATTLFNSIKGEMWRPGMWARIRGPLSLYRGDIGFIFSRSSKTTQDRSLWVAVVPRVDIHKRKGCRRHRVPAQRLNVNDLRHYLNIEVEFGKDFIFRDQTFNYSGYLLYCLEELDLFPPNPFPPVPFLNEFDQFLGFPVLRKEKWARQRLAVWQRRSAADDRVKILNGQFKGMIGVILSVSNEEAEVYLPQVDETTVVGVSNLRLELCIGDHVRVVQGEHMGTLGFITEIDGEWIDVVNPKEVTELHILAVDVEFHTAPTVMRVETHSFEVGDEVRAIAGPYKTGLALGTVSTIQDGWLEVTTYQENAPIHIFYNDIVHTTNPKTNRVLEAIQKGQIDIYAQYCGRYCVVISGPWKSHRGLIKTTHPDGRLEVELETRREQLTPFKFDNILIQDNKLALPLPQPVSAFSFEPATLVPERRPIAILFPDVNIAHTPTWRPWYKAPPSTGTSSDPQFPLAHPSLNLPVPTWLLSGEFVPHRIKLIEITDEGRRVEYLMPAEDGSGVLVRDVKNRSVHVEHLRHLPPEKKNDIVVPLTGDFKAQAMKVKEFGPDECTLTILGAKRVQKKDYNFPCCRTNELALIAPAKQ